MLDGIPRPVATPISAIPMVPAVVQEEPVARDTIQQSRQAANRKMLGFRISSP